ncbi:MAG: hypothetical protein Q9161_003427 [Pseudevernia consocians]
MTSDAIGLFFDDPTSANRFWAAPALFACALFDFFVSASKVYGMWVVSKEDDRAARLAE